MMACMTGSDRNLLRGVACLSRWSTGKGCDILGLPSDDSSTGVNCRDGLQS